VITMTVVPAVAHALAGVLMARVRIIPAVLHALTGVHVVTVPTGGLQRSMTCPSSAGIACPWVGSWSA
jgi:hypothetical protein